MFIALGDTYFPPEFEGDISGGDATSIAICENFYRTGPLLLRMAFRATMIAVEYSVIFTLKKFARFTGLNGEDRLKHLQRVSRQVWFAPLRPFISIGIYSRPDAIARLGYHNRGKAA